MESFTKLDLFAARLGVGLGRVRRSLVCPAEPATLVRPNRDPVERLIEMLARLPGMGRRSARRAALRMLSEPEGLLLPLADALREAAASVRRCEICGNLDAWSPCRVCGDAERDKSLVCVVEGVSDLWALERAHAHQGVYHVLGGTLSAFGSIGPDDLAIRGLLSRVAAGDVREVILALPATVDGASTAHLLADRLEPTGVVVTRPAQGVPIGGALDSLDDGTLATALKARR